MAIINNEELGESLNYHLTIENIIAKEIRTINGNKSHLDKIVPENITQVYSKKEKDAQYFVKNLYKSFYESSVISLVSSFEKVVFTKYKASYGSIKTLVGANCNKPLDYYKSRERFVNGNLDKLHGILDLIDGHIEVNLFEQLKKIKAQRDFYAHGKRFGEAPSVEPKLEEIATILDKIIFEIEK